VTQKAIEASEKAISLNSENANAQFSKSLTLLKMGNFEEGWHLYEWRRNPNRKIPPIRQNANINNHFGLIVSISEGTHSPGIKNEASARQPNFAGLPNRCSILVVKSSSMCRSNSKT